MPRLVWSKTAVADLARLRRFLAVHDSDAAVRGIQTIRGGVKVLEKNPEAGRKVEGIPPEFRERVVEFGKRASVIRYQIHRKQLLILAVRHGREVGH